MRKISLLLILFILTSSLSVNYILADADYDRNIFSTNILLRSNEIENTGVTDNTGNTENTTESDGATENNASSENNEGESKPQSSNTEDTNTEDSIQNEMPVPNVTMDLTAKSAVLMEGSTGNVIYEKNKDERLSPASITKIMTLLLIFEALDSGKISLEDEVSVSEFAASMGGSQVYLEPYEVQTVDTMIKCITISSANDASVAMGELIAGSEEEFAARMNERAKQLGMENTNFVNCSGLPADNHYSSAYDVALMSRELITKHPAITNYSTVWMDTIIHTTKKGQSEFGLSNTNKLVKTYDGITGLKTGSTDEAKYCLSATARRNDMDLISVIMGAAEHKARYIEASKLLDYGFANCSIYKDKDNTVIPPFPVKKGKTDEVQGIVDTEFSYLCHSGNSPEGITKEILYYDDLTAPIQMSEKIGEVSYKLNDKVIGSVGIVAAEVIEQAKYKDYLLDVVFKFFMAANISK